MFSKLFLTILSVGIIQCLERNEPKCYSKFDWEDKLLEKSIRTELAMQQYAKSMDTALEEIRAHKEEFNTMKATLKQTVEQMKASVNSTVEILKTSVEAQMSQTVETVRKLKEELQTATVMFSARSLDDYSPARGQIMIFSTIIQNIGDGYDSSTGVFTASVNGTFVFNVQFCVHANKWAQFQLAVDRSDNLILTFRHRNSDHADVMGTSIAHYLSEGQKMQLLTNAWFPGNNRNMTKKSVIKVLPEVSAAIVSSEDDDNPPQQRRRLHDLIHESHEIYNTFMTRRLSRILREYGLPKVLLNN